MIYLAWRTVDTRHNRLKALSLFTEADVPVGVRVPFKVCEALTSRAERFSTVYREFGVLIGEMCAMLDTFNCVISEPSRAAIRLWRAHLSWAEVQTVKGALRGRSLVYSWRVSNSAPHD